MTSDEVWADLRKLRGPLEALGTLLASDGEEAHLVVVGGVAILARRVRTRATADVDVIARGEVDPEGEIRLVAPDPLPTGLRAAIKRVARDFGLRPDWLNTVIGKQWRQAPLDLPPRLAEETTWHTTGGLHVGIAGRSSLIALKLYAAVDSGPDSVHTQDLLALAPTEPDLVEAAA